MRTDDMVRRMKWSGVVLVALVCAMPVVTDAKTLYVNGATGSDAITYAANDENNPWRTIGRAAWGSTTRSLPNAMQAAQAGDTVLIAAGTYSISHTAADYTDIAYNPVNSGTAGSYIRFRGVGTVTLQNSGSGPLIGANGRHYIEWDNFTIYEQNALPTYRGGSYAYGVVTVNSSDYSRILSLKLYGHVLALGDVHYAIFLSGSSTGTLVKNNYISGFVKDTLFIGSDNGGGIMTYGTSDTIIENNEITGCGGAIYSKNAHGGDGYRHIIRYNLLYGNYKGVLLQEVHDAKVYQNVIRNGIGDSIGVKLQYERVLRAIIANNTFANLQAAWYGNVGTGVDSWSDNLFQNNLIYNASAGVEFQSSTVFSGLASFHRNNYYNVNRWRHGSDYTSLDRWQTVSGSPDQGSSISNPLFVDAANWNFHLQGGSPVLTLGVDLLDLNGDGSTVDTIPAGAYVIGNEVIGRVSVSSDVTPPATPTGLNIR